MGKNLTKEQQYLIVAVIGLCLGLYFYWSYLLKPTSEKISSQAKKLADLKNQVQQAERQAKRLPALKSEYDTLQKELAGIERQLPKDRDMPNIIRTITREALRENLEFAKVVPNNVERQEYFEKLPFSLEMKGSLHSLARFLAALGQQERIFGAGDLTLRPGTTAIDGQVGLTITLTLETYAYQG